MQFVAASWRSLSETWMNVLGLSTSTQCSCRVPYSPKPGKDTPGDGTHECPCKSQPILTKVQQNQLLFGFHSFGVTGRAPFAPFSLSNLSWKLCCDQICSPFTVAHALEVVLVRLLDLSQRVVGSLVVREVHFLAFRDAEGLQGPSSLSVLVENHTSAPNPP